MAIPTKSIDVLLPVHGDCPFLEEAVRSVLSQKGIDYNLVIVQDRPGEKSKSLIEAFVHEYPNVHTLISEFIGIAEALNVGILNTSSKYIARIDADDLMLEPRLKTQFSYLEDNPETGVLGTQLVLIDESGHTIGRGRKPQKPKSIRNVMNFQNCIAHPSVMIRRSVLDRVGSYSSFITGAEDYDLWLRILQDSEVRNLGVALTKYRISKIQFSANLGKRSELIENAARLRSLLERNHLFDSSDLKREISNVQDLKEFLNSGTKTLRKSSLSCYRIFLFGLNAEKLRHISSSQDKYGFLKIPFILILLCVLSPRLVIVLFFQKTLDFINPRIN